MSIVEGGKDEYIRREVCIYPAAVSNVSCPTSALFVEIIVQMHGKGVEEFGAVVIYLSQPIYRGSRICLPYSTQI
jgi:hypothetical protein